MKKKQEQGNVNLLRSFYVNLPFFTLNDLILHKFANNWHELPALYHKLFFRKKFQLALSYLEMSFLGRKLSI